MKIPKTTTIKASRSTSEPVLTLSGFWLARFGFEIGTPVSIYELNGFLILKLRGVRSEYDSFLSTKFPKDSYVVSRPIKNTFMPQLTLTGNQLENYGFNIGNHVLINVKWGFIYLKHCPKDSLMF